jgi:uncharacterized Zn-binding protein involved in type VI secretion
MKKGTISDGLIRIGDRTSHGGIVITGDLTWKVDGRPVARIGDKATCPLCKRVVTIISSRHPTLTSGNIPAAYDGDMTDCGATLISSVSREHGWGGGTSTQIGKSDEQEEDKQEENEQEENKREEDEPEEMAYNHEE